VCVILYLLFSFTDDIGKLIYDISQYCGTRLIAPCLNVHKFLEKDIRLLSAASAELVRSRLISNGLRRDDSKENSSDDATFINKMVEEGISLQNSSSVSKYPAATLFHWLCHHAPLVEPARCTASGDDLKGSVAGIASSFTVVAQDHNGKRLLSSSGIVRAKIVPMTKWLVSRKVPDWRTEKIRWTKKRDFHDLQTQMCCIPDGKGHIFLIAGNNKRECFRYNISTDGVYPIAKLPCSNRGMGGCCLEDGRIFVVGGYQHGTWIYNPKSNSWINRARVNLGWGPACVFDKRTGLVHTVGGERRSNYHYVYDVKRNAWTQKPRTPIGFKCGGLVLAGSCLFAFGGYPNYRRIYKKDLMAPNNAWVSCAYMPRNNCQFGYANVADSFIVVVGGSSNISNNGNPQYSFVDTYDIAKNVWSTNKCKLFSGLREMAVCYVDDKLHVFGGYGKNKVCVVVYVVLLSCVSVVIGQCMLFLFVYIYNSAA